MSANIPKWQERTETRSICAMRAVIADLRAENATMRAAIAASQAPAIGSSIDTPKFRVLLLEDEVASPDRDDGPHMRKRYDECRAALIAHINAHTAQAVAQAHEAGRKKGRMEALAELQPAYIAEKERADKADQSVAEYARLPKAARLAIELVAPQPQAQAMNFEQWYTSITIEGDMRHNMERAWNAAPGQRSAPLAASAPKGMRQVLQGLVDEFVKMYPIYYYAEPWAHEKNAALLHAKAILASKEPQ